MTRQPGGAAATGDDPLLGTVIADRYRILEKIGEGGMGAVYRGVHETLRKPVAIKLLLRGGRADRETVARFEREAVASANLKHPNIAEATDFGQTSDGTRFLVMEYIEGRSLRRIIQEDGRLPPARARHLLEQIGAALVFAHGLDVVHRDLKPENVVVFARGEERDLVKVIDFGIARMQSSFGGGPTSLTATGTVMGTADYMAPEQAMGQVVDHRADQYALGVIAFELLTGKAPFQADNLASLLYMHVGAPIPRPSEHAPGLPAALDPVIATMMGKLPDERFASTAQALAALAAALDPGAPASRAGAPAFTPPASLPTAAPATSQAIVPLPSPSRPMAPRPPPLLLIVGAAGGGALLLILLVAVAIGLLRGGSKAPSSAITAVTEAWAAHRYEEAVPALKSLLSTYPSAAEDPELTRALAGSIRDPDTERQLGEVLDATPLGKSSAMSAALADVAVRGSPVERDATLRLLRNRHAQLLPEPRARVELRDAEDCATMQGALSTLGESPTHADVQSFRNGECRRLLRKLKLCDECAGSVESPKGKPKGKGKGHGKGG